MPDENDNGRAGKLFLGGVPVEPDVKKIETAVGTPEEGKLIPYETIESILKLNRMSNRFKGVTDAWRRKLLRENNVRMLCVDGLGFCAGTPEQRVAEIVDRTAHVRIHLSRTCNLGQLVDADRLPEAQRKALAHYNHANASHALAMATDRKRLKAGLPPAVSERRD